MLILPAYSVYSHDNKEWYLPFEIRVDFDESLGYYYYIIRNVDISYTAEYNDLENYPIFISNINVKSNFTTHKYTLRFDYNKDENFDLTNVTFKVTIDGKNFHWEKDDFIPIEYDSQSGYFQYEFDHDYIPVGDLKIVIMTFKDGITLLNKYSTTTYFKYDLSSMTQSQVIEEEINGSTTRRLLDIPGIEKQWFDSLEEIDKKYFEMEIIQKMINLYDSTSMRMLNTFVNMKFPKTNGLVTNIYYNKPHLEVEQIVNSRNDIVNLDVGYYYAINGPVDSTDMFAGKEGYIALCTSTSPETWEYTYMPPSTLILDKENEKKYFFNGQKWYRPIDEDPPKFVLPIKIKAILYTVSGSIAFVEKAKTALLEHFSPKFGIDKSIYRSEIISVLQNIEGVNYVRLIDPEIDIYFEYEMKDLINSELIYYVPEYIWFRKEDIEIDVKLGNEVKGSTV